MVRAAALGAINYSQADPTDVNWRIRHRLLLGEMQRQESLRVFDTVHRHWLAYVAHGNLVEESYDAVKKRADDALVDIQKTVYPWIKAETPPEKPEGKKDTIKPEISPETRALIERYEKMKAELAKANS
jgi:hypothetical protein